MAEPRAGATGSPDGADLPVLSKRAARAADERAIEQWGIPSFALMESAGRACADEVQRLSTAAESDFALVLCGPGNNGGDGLVVARTLHNRGVDVRLVAVGGAEALERGSPDVARNLALWRGVGGVVDELPTGAPAEALAELRTSLDGAAVVVDALFGTGLARPLEGVFHAVVESANTVTARRLAVDVPSGLDADTGEVRGIAFRADFTVTFVARRSPRGRRDRRPARLRARGRRELSSDLMAQDGAPLARGVGWSRVRGPGAARGGRCSPASATRGSADDRPRRAGR